MTAGSLSWLYKIWKRPHRQECLWGALQSCDVKALPFPGDCRNLQLFSLLIMPASCEKSLMR